MSAGWVIIVCCGLVAVVGLVAGLAGLRESRRARVWEAEAGEAARPGSHRGGRKTAQNNRLLQP